MENAEQLYMDGSCKLAVYIISSFENGKGLQENDAIQIDPALRQVQCTKIVKFLYIC